MEEEFTVVVILDEPRTQKSPLVQTSITPNGNYTA